eukprot:symbB.v1.2.000138.t1/scaffold16.1/size461936/12
MALRHHSSLGAKVVASLGDGALKTYAQSAPADYNLLLLQLKTQPWLCGGTTGHPCDAPDTAPLNEQSWNNVVSGKDPNKTAVFAERLMHWRFGMEVSNKPALMEWARSPPNDFTLALQQLKGAKFMCGGTEKPCGSSVPLPTTKASNQETIGAHAINLLVTAFCDDPGTFRVAVDVAASNGYGHVDTVGYVRWLATLAVHVIPAINGDGLMSGLALLLRPGTYLEAQLGREER